MGAPQYYHPGLYDSVNNRIKDSILQGFSLSYPALSLEDGPVMAPRLFRHLEPEPVCPQNAERPGPHSIPR